MNTQSHDTLKRHEKWTIVKASFVIGSMLLLVIAAVMASVAIDEQARHASVATGEFQASR